jgi:hypothetical protein
MKPENKRVQLAKDVLAQLQIGFLEASQGGYVTIFDSKFDENSNTQLDEILPEISKCEVCAKGAFFIAGVLRNDRITCYESYNPGSHKIEHYLRGIFSKRMLDQIEAAFERWEPSLFSEVPSRSTRLRLIAENLIVSKGNFNMKLYPVWDGEWDSGNWTTPGYKELVQKEKAKLKTKIKK